MTYKLFDEHGNRLPRNYVTAVERRAAKAAAPMRPLTRAARLAARKERTERNAKRRERYALSRAKEPYKEQQARLHARRKELVRQGWREYYARAVAEGKYSAAEAKAKLAQYGVHED